MDIVPNTPGHLLEMSNPSSLSIQSDNRRADQASLPFGPTTFACVISTRERFPAIIEPSLLLTALV